MKGTKKAVLIIALLFSFSVAFGQSGGSFRITSSVIAGGGGPSTGSGNLSVESTVAQPDAVDLMRQPPFSLRGGYQYATLGLTPTAAPAVISGQLATRNGAGLAGVTITLSGSRTQRAITDASGLYLFNDLEVGGFYTITPSRANYSVSPSNRSLTLIADKTDAVFTATPLVNTANPLDTTEFFVRQHYLDFLGREPDAGGLNYWSGELDKCNGDQDCLRQRRIGISAAFFIETEFQQTGSFVYRLYRGALGRQIGYAEFNTDRSKVIGGDTLEQSKAAFADAFVRRAEFVKKYSDATTADAFVAALIRTMEQSGGVDLSASREGLIAKYITGRDMEQSRSLTIGQAIDDSAFKQAVYNPSFVLMQYFGYLRRDPEQAGFDFWLNVLNNKEPNNYRGMVCSFITSGEYQKRFSSVETHSNDECR
jgi:hypothetical protein